MNISATATSAHALQHMRALTSVRQDDSTPTVCLKILTQSALKVVAAVFALFETIACCVFLAGGIFLRPFAPDAYAKMIQRAQSAAQTVIGALVAPFSISPPSAQAAHHSPTWLGKMRQLSSKLSACINHRPLVMNMLGIVGIAALIFVSCRHAETVKALFVHRLFGMAPTRTQWGYLRDATVALGTLKVRTYLQICEEWEAAFPDYLTFLCGIVCAAVCVGLFELVFCGMIRDRMFDRLSTLYVLSEVGQIEADCIKRAKKLSIKLGMCTPMRVLTPMRKLVEKIVMYPSDDTVKKLVSFCPFLSYLVEKEKEKEKGA